MSTDGDSQSDAPTPSTDDVQTDRVYDFAETTGHLVVLKGPDDRRRIELEGDEVVVGRAGSADITVPDTGVSKRHFRLAGDGEHVYIEDLESSNGTLVNGEQVDNIATLSEGDTIAVGTETLFRYTRLEEPLDETDDRDIRVVVGAEGNWFRVDDGDPVDLRRRGALRRILDELTRRATGGADQGLDVHELFEIGWPDQKIDPELAADRVYWVVRTLRNNGLRDILVTTDAGYLLATDLAAVERRPDRRQPPTPEE